MLPLNSKEELPQHRVVVETSLLITYHSDTKSKLKENGWVDLISKMVRLPMLLVVEEEAEVEEEGGSVEEVYGEGVDVQCGTEMEGSIFGLRTLQRQKLIVSTTTTIWKRLK
jgi:hypothetical protein